MSRTRKRPYTGSKRFDSSCRNHGSCGYCQNRRLHKIRKREVSAKEQLKEYSKEPRNTEIT